VISCEAFLAQFGPYLEGDLGADLRHQLESHVSHCRTCEILYDSTRKTLKIVTESASFDLPEDAAKAITDRIMARIRKDFGPDLP
jgi:dihydroneopterin aldolase